MTPITAVAAGGFAILGLGHPGAVVRASREVT
jgi:hypothetical protein